MIRLECLNQNDPDQIGWIYKVRTDPEVASHFFAPPPKKFIDHVQFLKRCEENRERQFFIVYADSLPCGYCQIIHALESYEVGFALHPLWWGKGIGSISVKLLLQYVYNNYLEKKKIILQVRKNNLRAISLYKKHGFIIAGNNDKEDGYLMELSAWP